ncbi:MAG: hypothetical protein NTX50_32495 [Candidatus Sumerlaeota bacterium]|nr:hypothetical protein [Candidatus Sumerlaeota bacterium]
MTAIEMTGDVDEACHLHLEGSLPIRGPKRVRVIVLYPYQDEIGEQEWLHAAAVNPAFDDLAAPEEDMYSLSDGRPMNDAI